MGHPGGLDSHRLPFRIATRKDFGMGSNPCSEPLRRGMICYSQAAMSD